MGKKILLADDSVTIQKVVELTFAETDYQVLGVSSGRELLAKLPQERPDLVLCDVVMPDISGYEVCQRIKSDPSTLHIPVVLLTGTFEPFDRDRALAAGCDAIVTKPFEARALISTVDELLAKASQAPAAPSEEELMGLGVPEGVPALDFTTTGFDRMVPPPEQPPAPPEYGLELTTSSMQSAVSPPPPPPPELAPSGEEPFGVPAASAQEAVAPWPESQAHQVLDQTPLAQLPQQEPEAAPVPGLGEAFRQEPAFPLGEEASVPQTPASPAEEAGWLSPAAAPKADTGPALAVPEEEVETVPPGEFPASQEPPAPAPQVQLDGLVERVVEEVLRRLPLPAPTSPSSLGEEDLERLARRVLELATPLLERIAWEVIPDLAEMLVRQRIAELEAAAESD
jgi:CheY-like chemotaxis protein